MQSVEVGLIKQNANYLKISEARAQVVKTAEIPFPYALRFSLKKAHLQHRYHADLLEVLHYLLDGQLLTEDQWTKTMQNINMAQSAIRQKLRDTTPAPDQ